MPRIDTHQHLIYPDSFTYEWAAGVPALAGRAFTLDDYRAASAGCGITGTLFMEVDVPVTQSGTEAAFFSRLAEDPSSKILGVIAQGRPENDGFEAYLDSIRHPKLVGLRRILHTQPDDLPVGGLFRKQVGMLGKAGLTFDICALARQLPLVMALIDACPDTPFILDHCGNPDVAAGILDPWGKDLRDLSRRPNVACKISGIIVNADPSNLTPAAFRPFVEHCIECFGWDRVVFGGDWPVCNLTANLGTWVSILDEILASADPADRAKLDHLNATRIYGLRP
jgi:predicted TIM-barrel fold metal-dependent hydrolase